jgi:putative FmdB family regulatory protein
MPIYEYACEAGHRFEVKQKFSDAPVTTCQVCSLPVTKLISPSAISFKGAGWYVTDYSEKFKPPGTQEKTGTEEKPAAAIDAKNDTKKDSASSADTKSSSSDSAGSTTSPPSTSTTGSSSSTSTPSGS